MHSPHAESYSPALVKLRTKLKQSFIVGMCPTTLLKYKSDKCLLNLHTCSLHLVQFHSANLNLCIIFKAQVKLCFTSAFNKWKFLSIFLSFFLSISDIPNLDLNNSTNPLLKSTPPNLVPNYLPNLEPEDSKQHLFKSSTAVVDIVDIEEHRKLTPSD